MAAPTQSDIDYLVKNPHVWRKFETTFGSLPDGFKPPVPQQSDYDYLAENPAVKDRFVETFGQGAYDSWTAPTPDSEINVPPEEMLPVERKHGGRALLGAMKSAYDADGLTGVKNFLMTAPDPQLVEDFLTVGGEGDDSFWAKYKNRQNDATLMTMRSVSRLGEGLAFLPEGTLKYLGFENAAQAPQHVRELYSTAEKEFVAAMSPEARRAIEQQFVERAADDSLQFGEGATNPLWWLATGIDMAVMMAPGIGIGGKASRMAYGAAYAKTLAKAGAAKAPTAVAVRAAEAAGKKAALRASVIAYTGGEALPASGMAGAQVRETLDSLDEETLLSYEPYRGMREQGLSHEAARAKIANDQAIKGALAVAVVTGVTGYPVSKLIARFAEGGGIAATAAGAAVKGAAAEGAQEFLQEGSQQLIQNMTEKPITHIDPWEGVLESAITGAAVGGALGGAMGAAAGADKPTKDMDPNRAPAVRKSLREYNAARDNLFNAIGTARDPNVQITQADIDAAREQYRVASVSLGEALLASGRLSAEEQVKISESLEQAKASGIKGLQDGDVKGAVRAADEAGAPQGDAGVATETTETPKQGAEARQTLNSAEEARLGALDKVANADTVTAEEMQGLVKAGLAKVLPSGVPMLLPAGKRVRKELADRVAAAEAAGATEKPAAESKAKPTPKAAEKPAAQPAKPAAAAEPKTADLAPGYSDADVVKPGEKVKPVPVEKTTETLSETEYGALERLADGKPVAAEEIKGLVEAGLVAPRDGGKSHVIRPAGRRELKAYRESGRLTAAERPMQADIGITGATLRLSAEARRTGRKARREAVEASEQIAAVFEATKAAAGAKVAADLERIAAEQEAELAAAKERDWQNAKDEVELDEFETLTTLFDEETRGTLRGSVRGILKQVDAAARRREAAARGRLKVAFSERRAYDVGGALVEGSKVWKDVVEVGAMKILQGLVRIPDWNASMQMAFKKQWREVSPHLAKLYKQSREVAQNPLDLLKIKHKKAHSKTTRMRGQPEGRGMDILRAQVEALRAEGEPHRFWYEKSGAAILKVVGGDIEKARKLAGLLAIYSSGTAVDANTGNAMKAWYQWLDGQKIATGEKLTVKAGRFRSQDRDAEAWLSRGEFPAGTKRSNFYVNLMREIDPKEFDGFQGATVDLWMMRAFGYYAEAPGDAQYAFVSTEIQRIAQELDWEPQQVQAAVWVAVKARYEATEYDAKVEAARRKYIRFIPGPKGKDVMEVLDPRRYNRLRRDYALKNLFSEKAANQAGRDFSTELAARMAQINWESRPSVSVGLLPGIHSETNPARIAEYHAAIAQALQDETGSDAIARRLGMLSFGQIDGPSAWFYNRDDYFRFKHYSKRLRDEYVTLDIEKFGTGVAMTAQERSRGPRIFLYPENAEVIESALTGGTEYTVEVLKDDMYDFTADPMGLRKGKSFDAAEDAIRLAGFRGYFVKDHSDAMLRGQARLFHSHPAVRSDVTNKFRGYVGSGSALRVPVPRLHGNSGEKNSPKVEKAAAEKMSAYSAILGALIKQDAVSWAMPFYTSDVAYSNGVDIELGRTLTALEASQLYRSTVSQMAARGVTEDAALHAFAPIQHESGAYFLNFGHVPNTDFHQIIRNAVDEVFSGNGYLAQQDVPDIVLSRFASDGTLIENNWKVEKNGEGYRRRAEEAGEGAAFEWAISVLGPKIAKINKDFAERYGWDRSADRATEALKPTRSRRLKGQPAEVAGPAGVMTPVTPSVRLRLVAEAYMRSAGLAYNPPQDFVPMDEDLARRVATAYGELKHDAKNAEVRAAYAAMIDETMAQWQWIKKSGLKVEVIPPGSPDPYEGNPRNAITDIAENNHFWLFPTVSGLGDPVHGETPADHPILAKTGEKIGDYELLANDVFRIVHDVFGHAKDGIGFRANGEYNAWRQHSAMYTPAARRAMSAETLGQNSWLNHGPFGEVNRTARIEDTIFAEQKAVLLPEEFTSDEAIMASPATPGSGTMTVADVEEAIREVREEIGMPIRVVRTFADLPKHIRDWARAREIDPAGVFAARQGVMYIVADRMKSSHEAIETYAHEVVGHYGLRGLLGKRFRPMMEQIAKAFPEQMSRIATMQKIKRGPIENELNIAEELVAHGAGLAFRGNGQLPARSVWRRIVDFFREQLRSFGFLNTWTQEDLDALIARSADFVQSGRAKRAKARRAIAEAQGKKLPAIGEEMASDTGIPMRTRPGTGFAEWFRGSKAVDANGSPRVFHHATRNAFKKFRIGRHRRGSADAFSRKAGLFFASSNAAAGEFVPDAARVMPVYISTQNPLDIRGGFQSLPADVRERLQEAFDSHGLSMRYFDSIPADAMWKSFDADYGFGTELVSALTEAGYDGAMITESGQESWVVFSPNQVKSIFNGGEYSLANDDIFASAGAAPIYYSVVARAVEAVKMERAKGHQWLGIIKNSPGVKQGEIEWLLLGDYLQANETYTKDQVLSYIDENKIDLREVVKWRNPTGTVYDSNEDVTKFAKWQLPGGENYRELLLMLPTIMDPDMRFQVIGAFPATFNTRKEAEEYIAGFGAISDPYLNARMAALPFSIREYAEPDDRYFMSGHWDEPNVLAHIRFNDRTDADGKRVLFIEEIQSDWHQKGRKKGYASNKPPADLSVRQLPNGQFVGDWNGMGRSVGPYATREQVIAEATAKQGSGIPDAPFKTTWHELAIKRMLRFAVDGGYDRIAWTPGEVQADRYDLSKQIERIEYNESAQGGRLTAEKNNELLILETGVTPDKLENYIGKEAARNLLDAPLTGDGNQWRVLEGLDLKVGGDGMRGFYDKILVDAFNKFGKKFGALVWRTKIPVRQTDDFEVVDTRGNVLFAGSSRSIADEVLARENRREPGSARIEYRTKDIPAHSIDITPQMQSAIPGGMPMFAPYRPATGNPDLDAFYSKIGKQHIPIREKISQFFEGLGDRVRQQALDHFHGIARTGDIEGYMSARLSTGTAGLMRAIMEWGHPVWDNGLHGVAGDHGFLDIIRPLGNDVEAWAAWMVARRADRLKGEGRENLFSQDEIDAALATGNGRQDFIAAAEQYAEFKKKILDFAEAAGIVDPTTRPLWENDDHVPFYRIMEDGLLKGARAGRGLGFVKKQIVQLKGGSQNIGDPIENILRNWTALIEASVQAQAARTIIDNLTGTGLVVKIDDPSLTHVMNTQALQQLLTQAQINPASMSPASQSGLLALSQPAANKDGVITIWRDGKRERWQVHDPMLFKSMQSISPDAWSPWMELLRAPKRVLTKTINVVPLFIVRNFWRDIWSAFTIGTTNRQAIPFVPILDNLKGAAEMLRRTDTSKTLIASGAGFVGTGFNPRDAAAEAVSLAKDVRLGHRFWHSPALLYKAYMRLSEAAENASRVAIYEAAIKSGRSKMESAFEAKDVMDFSLRGSSSIARFFVETVPFWGARTQGLYKLGRAFAGNPAGVFLRGMLLTMGTLAMFLRNYDDERYKELTLDQKNLYWHAFDLLEDGDHWMIPKPFEVGTIFGIVPEAMLDAFITNAKEPDAAKQSLQVISHAFTQALDLKPEIAAVWPLVELALNKNTFTGAPILNMGDRGVLPEEQDAPFVRSTYRLLAHAMPDAAPEALRSPKQLQHLARGYMGSLQDWVLFATDKVAQNVSGEGAPPKGAATEPLFIGGFRRTGPARQTKPLNELYTIAEETNAIVKSIDKLTGQQITPAGERRVEQLVETKAFEIGVAKNFADAVKQVSDLRKAQRAIQLDKVMSPQEKRQKIEEIQNGINEIARGMWPVRPGGPIQAETASKLMGASKNTQAAILRREGLRATSALVDSMPERPSRKMLTAFKDLEMRA